MIFIALGTVALWCANSALDKYVGQMGIVAIIPMVFFFGFGLLNKASLCSPWQAPAYTLNDCYSCAKMTLADMCRRGINCTDITC